MTLSLDVTKEIPAIKSKLGLLGPLSDKNNVDMKVERFNLQTKPRQGVSSEFVADNNSISLEVKDGSGAGVLNGNKFQINLDQNEINLGHSKKVKIGDEKYNPLVEINGTLRVNGSEVKSRAVDPSYQAKPTGEVIFDHRVYVKTWVGILNPRQEFRAFDFFPYDSMILEVGGTIFFNELSIPIPYNITESNRFYALKEGRNLVMGVCVPETATAWIVNVIDDPSSSSFIPSSSTVKVRLWVKYTDESTFVIKNPKRNEKKIPPFF